jgi:hypothetical protein
VSSRRTGTRSTSFRVTPMCVAENQHITLSVPRALLKRVKRVAADRETSVSTSQRHARSEDHLDPRIGLFHIGGSLGAGGPLSL